MTDTTTTRTTRAERLAMPLAREVVHDLAVEHGACIRPVQLRRTNLDTGEIEQVLVPCGHTLASVCPSCAERARRCGPRNAGKAGTSSTSPSSTPTRPPRTSGGGSGNAPKPSGSAIRPRRPGKTPATWTSSSPSWTARSPARGCAGRCSRPGPRGGTAPPGAARTPRTCPAARSPAGRSGRPTRAGREDVPAVDVPHPDLPQLRAGPRGRHPCRPGSYDYAGAARDALHSRRCSTG